MSVGATTAGTPAAASLRVEGVSLSFGGLKALQNVSFDVAPGTITALIGPNGAGKTSMFNCISGFYKPDTGRIVMDGRDVSALHAPARAKLGFARTFQNIALFRGMTVLDNIKLGRHAHLKTNVFQAFTYFGAAAREEEALRAEIERDVIDFLEINHIRNAPVAALSYGLQKRVELARALAMRPRILLLDEPVAGMNREETEDMARFILDVKEEWGISILMVEHDMGMVMDISDHVVVLNFGQVIARGLPHEVQGNPEVVAAYLGSGDPAALMKRLAEEAGA
jgi:branched-chain amino acid transport system ATP-binding protein